MDFRTRIPEKEGEPKIDHHAGIFLAGSCFVENIGKKLEYYKFRNLLNSFGILFHPLAVENFIARINSEYTYSEEDIFFHNERWHCFEAHSALSQPDRAGLVDTLNKELQKSRDFLKEATHAVITLGTAWGYEHKESNRIVANCHKLPQKYFKKNLFSVEAVTSSLERIKKSFKELNPGLTFIFTVSPVRHLRDGFTENQQSKAHLISAVHSTTGANYFPSYEIMMDELRDYRFYAEDMLHPSPFGNHKLSYIFYLFTNKRRIGLQPIPLVIAALTVPDPKNNQEYHYSTDYKISHT